MQTILVQLGQRISELRQNRGLTQEKLAELVQYSPNHISKLETARTNPSFELIVNIAKALNVDLYELFNFDNKNRHNKTTSEIKNEINSILNNANKKKLELIYKIANIIDF